jgi:hypothetical protein
MSDGEERETKPFKFVTGKFRAPARSKKWPDLLTFVQLVIAFLLPKLKLQKLMHVYRL